MVGHPFDVAGEGQHVVDKTYSQMWRKNRVYI